MNNNSLIIGFEGPCLSGKTVTISKLAAKLKKQNCHVLVVNEYTEWVNGHQNFPPLRSNSNIKKRKYSEFFLNLEQQRMQYIDEWLYSVNDFKKRVILVDRLLVSCLLLRKKLDDKIGYDVILNAIKNNGFIKSNLTFYLRLPKNKYEFERRMKQRVKFDGSDIIYDSSGYEEFFKNVNKHIINLRMIILDPVGLDARLKLILNNISRNIQLK